MNNVPVTEALNMQKSFQVNAGQLELSQSSLKCLETFLMDTFSLYNSKGVKIDSKANIFEKGNVLLGSNFQKVWTLSKSPLIAYIRQDHY